TVGGSPEHVLRPAYLFEPTDERAWGGLHRQGDPGWPWGVGLGASGGCPGPRPTPRPEHRGPRGRRPAARVPLASGPRPRDRTPRRSPMTITRAPRSRSLRPRRALFSRWGRSS